MIITEFYIGQGLGNQLWSYITTRVIAKDKGYEFGISAPEKFWGADFLEVDYGKKVIGGSGPVGGPPESLPEGIENYYVEKEILHPLNGSDIRIYDKDLVSIADNTKIDGLMQDEQYIIHRKKEVKEWLKVKPEYECKDYSSDDICVINFRGGGYVQDKNFFLPPRYWKNAIANMRKINPNFKFVVVTEDVLTAKKFFPSFEVNHWSIAKDYVVVKNAHYLILSNSSFAWFPAWTSDTLKYCIAPKYWGRHNISDGYWSLGYNITQGWMYQDRQGDLSDYHSCLTELREYMAKNEKIFQGKVPYKPTFGTRVKSTLQIWNALSKDSFRLKALGNVAFMSLFKTVVGLRKKMATLKRRLVPLTGAQAKEEIEIFNLLKDDLKVVFDVGARDDMSFYHIKKDCSYHLFEPNKKFAKSLRRQRASFIKPDININEYGLSDKSGDNVVYYEKSQGFAINPYYKDGDIDTGTRYSLKTLDEYVSENNIPKIDFLKIDAEGLDFKVIVGGAKTIEAGKISYIQFEYWDSVSKTVDRLKDKFDLYLAMDRRLLGYITYFVTPLMTPEQKQIDYTRSLIPLTTPVLNLIDNKLGLMGYYGNIFAVNKNLKDFDLNKLMFEVKCPPLIHPSNHKISKIKALKSKLRTSIKDVTILHGYY